MYRHPATVPQVTCMMPCLEFHLLPWLRMITQDLSNGDYGPILGAQTSYTAVGWVLNISTPVANQNLTCIGNVAGFRNNTGHYNTTLYNAQQ